MSKSWDNEAATILAHRCRFWVNSDPTEKDMNLTRPQL